MRQAEKFEMPAFPVGCSSASVQDTHKLALAIFTLMQLMSNKAK